MPAPVRTALSSTLVRFVLASVVAFVTFLGGVAAAEADAAPVDIKIKFQLETAPTPVGYTPDYGYGYTTTAGSGWVREDSLNKPPSGHVGWNLHTKIRDRYTSDPLTRSFIIAEGGTPSARGAYDINVPNGSYDVTVGMGDPSAIDSHDWATVEGTSIIQEFIRPRPIRPLRRPRRSRSTTAA